MQAATGWSGGRLARFERGYDALALLLLMWPATAGMWLMGSTRTWGYAPGLALSLLGSLLVCARPLVFPDTPRRWFPPGFCVFAVLTLYVVLGVFRAPVPVAARWEALRWGCLLAAAWSWVQLAGRAHRWKWLLGVLLMAAALDSLYALIQEVNGSTQVLWAPRPEQYGRRASGTFLCPNHFANVLAMLFPLAAVLLFLPEAGVPLRLMAIYFLGVAAPVLYWTQSRSGWLGVLAGLGVAGLLLAWRRSRAWLLAALVALPLLAGALGWTAWKTLPAVRERLGAVLENPDQASGIRMQMWRDMPAMIRARPLFGHGGGSFVWTYPPFQHHINQHLTWDYLHNEYLQMQVEYGAVGLGLLLVGLAWAAAVLVRALVRARSRLAAALLAGAGGSAAAALVHALFDFNFHIFPNPHVLIWIVGVAWGVWFRQESGPTVPAIGRRGLRGMVAGLASAACGAGALLAVLGGVSYVWYLKGELARERMDWTAAEAYFRRSVAWDSWNGQPHLGLGHVYAVQAIWFRDPDPEAERREKQRLAGEARRHYEAARAANPCDMIAEYGLARIANVQDDRETALAHFRRAAAYQHRHVFYREQLGVQLRQMGREREALEVFRRNLEDGVASDVSRLNVRSLERRLARAAPGADPPALP